jgi:hypothetical protein
VQNQIKFCVAEAMDDLHEPLNIFFRNADGVWGDVARVSPLRGIQDHIPIGVLGNLSEILASNSVWAAGLQFTQNLTPGGHEGR